MGYLEVVVFVGCLSPFSPYIEFLCYYVMIIKEKGLTWYFYLDLALCWMERGQRKVQLWSQMFIPFDYSFISSLPWDNILLEYLKNNKLGHFMYVPILFIMLDRVCSLQFIEQIAVQLSVHRYPAC